MSLVVTAARLSGAAEEYSEWGSWEWYGASGDGRRGGSEAGAGLHGRAADAETEDDFAQRIWLEMERRRQQQQQSTFKCGPLPANICAARGHMPSSSRTTLHFVQVYPMWDACIRF